MNVDVGNIDNKDYIEIDKIECNGNTYVYLSNVDDMKDFCIRKIVAREGKVFYEGLKDNDEFDLALMYFIKKHKNFIREEIS